MELTAGNFFGEMSLISGRRRTATARAVGPTRIIEIPRKAILKLLGAAPRAKALVDQAFLLRAFGGYLFPGIPEAQLGELVELAVVNNLAKDAVVFREDEPADAFYLIRNGMVKISKKSGEKDVVLSYLVAGNFFGEAALFSDADRTATVTTIFPSDLIKLSKRDFNNFLAAHPELREAPLRKLEERRIAGLIADATPGSGNILGDLIREEVVMGTQTLIIDEHKCIRCGNCIAGCEGCARRRSGPPVADRHQVLQPAGAEFVLAVREPDVHARLPARRHRARSSRRGLHQEQLHRLRQLRAQLSLRQHLHGSQGAEEDDLLVGGLAPRQRTRRTRSSRPWP